ncbi:endo-1,4-beta-xylanase A precursor [Anaerotignum neopropionicum]|uniref:Endo-1,4-beta-xylanase A n=1 Tax=Anaerotignum neopropionicum TaxID=36847 RepID=A0A136WIH8_9FIRM|nr:S-layer homology domain-containing protein [Anaerotignum neopropionicum]KXL54230.1 endo-1,4-beta-xylanase A precursor [Anaerotignum neopropionicum]KXL54355.1 endo-1,4-beta-xylanase A precursor [Anaerotignum neopropionicum]
MQNILSAKGRRFLSAVLTLVMVMGLFVAFPLEARAADGTLSFSGSDADLFDGSNTTITRTIGEKTFTLTGAGGLWYDGQGLYAYEGPDDKVKLTIEIESEYMFDLSSFDAMADDGNVNADVTYANGNSESFPFGAINSSGLMTINVSGLPTQNITKVVLSSDNYAVFQNIELKNIQAISELAPTVTGISPSAGTTGGATIVTITGTNFIDVSDVKFGATAASSYTVNSETQITATSPEGSEGTVHVTVENWAGTSETGAADQFTYVEPPSVTTSTPVSYTDTSAYDTFTNTTGTISATSGGSITSYGISDGTVGSWEIEGKTYDASKAGTYGTLYVDSGSGEYVYVPNNGAINGTIENESETFTVTATDNSDLAGSATLTVNITGANDIPTDIALSNSSILENAGENGMVGSLSTIDIDHGDTFTYAIVGGDDASAFNINGTMLRMNSSANYAIQSSYTVSIRTMDMGGMTFDKQFTITVSNVNDPPTLTATPRNPTFTSGGSAVLLFSNTAVDTVEAGQMIKQLALTITNVMDGASEKIAIDGTKVALTTGNSGTSGGNDYTYQVSLTGGTATVVITKAGDISVSAVQTLVDGLAYENSSSSPTLLNRVITLTGIRDNGGTENGGEDSTSLSIVSTVIVSVEPPSAPSGCTAIAGDTSATVSFTPPASSGVTYTVLVNPSHVPSVSGTGSPIVVTGLTNGQAYTFTVTATNVGGTSAPSDPSNSVTPKLSQTITFNNPGAQNFSTTPQLEATASSNLPVTFSSSTTGVCTIDGNGYLTFITAGTATINADQPGNGSYLAAPQVSQSFTVNPVAPGAPTNVVATAGDGSASVAFSPPNFTGGTNISVYTVTGNSPYIAPVSGAGSPITVTGLTNGQAYTFTVTASNVAGDGPSSAPSNSVTPAASQTITFNNPGAQNFGTTPQLTASSDSSLTVSFRSETPEVCTITPEGVLTFIRAGQATITAEQEGNINYLPAIPVSRTFYVNGVEPGAPTIGTAKAGNGRATVSFTPPESNGGLEITSYIVTSNPGGITATGTTSPIVITGLTNGTDYTFTVAATSAVGTGGASLDSNSVTPRVASSSGGGGSSSTPTTTPVTTQAYKAEVKGESNSSTLPVAVDTNTGSASIDASTQIKLLSEGKGATITVPSIPDVASYTVGIPIPNLSTNSLMGSLTIDTANGTITLPSNMLTGAKGQDGSKAQITMGEGDKDNLPDQVKDAIGNRPLIQLTLAVDGNQTQWNNPAAPVMVAIPYTPTAKELENPESIVVWYIDGSGNVVTIPNGHYHAATGTVTFETTHFSDYGVAYNPVSFHDVAADAWYKKAVTFIAARGITTGTGDGNFSPEAKLTRGEFIVLMMKAYGIAPNTKAKDNFADAGNTYYTGYLATAKQLGITSGIGDNMYAPNKEITRQEMFTLLYNALKAIDQLPQGSVGKTLSDFTDAPQVDKWAVDAMTLLVKTGTVSGNGGKITPTGTTTRGEMVQVLYSLLRK